MVMKISHNRIANNNIAKSKLSVESAKNIKRKTQHSLNGILFFYFSLIFLLIISGCSQKPKAKGPVFGESPISQTIPVYHFAVHPLHNPAKLIEEYQPLVEYLNEKIKGAKFTIEASRVYQNFEQKYEDRKPEFILPNPWQTLQSIKTGYSVIAMAGEPKAFKGIFIVRNDSDLKGKSVSYPAATALAACTTWDFQRDHPKEAGELKLIWETEALINNSVMVRDDIPAEIREQVVNYLTGLHENEQGKALLLNMETARFIPATNKDYDVVNTYVERFEMEVRKIETK